MAFKEWKTGTDSEGNPVKSIFNTDQITRVDHGSDNSNCRVFTVGGATYQTVNETYATIKTALSAS